MIDPPQWTAEQFTADLETSTELFRKERMEEPLEDYLEAFDDYQGNIEELFETTVDLTDLGTTALNVLTDARLLDAFRYLAGPPISDDDLKTVAEAASLTPGTLRADPGLVTRIVQVVVTGLDSRRFPWVRVPRDPTEEEKNAAILASAALMATQRVGTNRRSEGKRRRKRKSAARWLLTASPRWRGGTSRRRRKHPTRASFARRANSAAERLTSSSASGTIGSCRSNARFPILPPTPSRG